MTKRKPRQPQKLNTELSRIADMLLSRYRLSSLSICQMHHCFRATRIGMEPHANDSISWTVRMETGYPLIHSDHTGDSEDNLDAAIAAAVASLDKWNADHPGRAKYNPEYVKIAEDVFVREGIDPPSTKHLDPRP